MPIVITDADESDLAAIVEIQNYEVRETAVAWSYQTVDLADRRVWLADKQAKDFPVLVARRDGETVGYASYGPFRPWDAYLHTVENSVYVRRDQLRQGIGQLLLGALIERALAQGHHVMIAGIESENTGSIAMHARFGFREAGRFPQVGAKFGRWLDLVLMQLDLNADPSPPA